MLQLYKPLKYENKMGMFTTKCSTPYLRRNNAIPEVEFDIFCDNDLAEFWTSHDLEMKRLQSEGYGTKAKQA